MLRNSKLRMIGSLVSGLLLHPYAAWPATAEASMDRVSQAMDNFVERLSDVKCSETVTQSKLDKNGHTEYSEESKFDYLVLLQASDDELMLNESRIAEKQGDTRHKKNVSLLITSGFSNLMLILHPYYRSSFEFQVGDTVMLDGKRLLRMQFAHIPGTRTPVALSVRGREFPLDLKGTAWIDPETNMVAKIEASLEKDMSDVGLKSLSVEVDYQPVQLRGWTQPYRFPAVATVNVESLRQRWRNVHRFTNYQQFMVDTETTVVGPGTK